MKSRKFSGKAFEAITVRRSDRIVYATLAAKTANDPSNRQLPLVMTITNNESTIVHLHQVSMTDLTIPSTKQWYLATANNVFLPRIELKGDMHN